jgi:hypothetical protein
MKHQVSASGSVNAPPDVVYRILADYRDGHPRILPPKAFPWLEVEEGGVGNGTRIRFGFRMLGRTSIARSIVTEPEPGRVLVESYPEQDATTTFVVDGTNDERSSRVTITTEMNVRDGLAGRLERFLTNVAMLPIYRDELRRLAEYAERRVIHPPVPRRGGV